MYETSDGSLGPGVLGDIQEDLYGPSREPGHQYLDPRTERMYAKKLAIEYPYIKGEAGALAALRSGYLPAFPISGKKNKELGPLSKALTGREITFAGPEVQGTADRFVNEVSPEDEKLGGALLKQLHPRKKKDFSRRQKREAVAALHAIHHHHGGELDQQIGGILYKHRRQVKQIQESM